MATKPSTAAEKALRKIQEQVTCGICLEPYKQPKLLKCFHVFCEHCLQTLVRREGQSLPCPACRKDTQLPVGGVSGLQGAFFHNAIVEIYDSFKISSNSCPKHPGKEADFYCETCSQLICTVCLESAHHGHHYDLLANIFAKQEKVIVEQIAALERAVESVDTRCAAVVEQKTAVMAKIHTAMAVLRVGLDKLC